METINYKGAIIKPSIYQGYDWEHPDYVDADYMGDGDWDTTGCGHAPTIEDCKEEIDEFLAEMEEVEKKLKIIN